MTKEKRKRSDTYSQPWRWKWPRVNIKIRFPNFKPVFMFLFGNWLKGFRRLSFIALIVVYNLFITWLHLGPDALTPVPDVVSTISEPQNIPGESQQFIVFHVASNVWFRVIGTNQYWRIFHECQNHVVTDLSGNAVRSECQHSDNFVKTNSTEWHRYTVRYDEEVRVVYQPGVAVELKVVTEPSGLSSLSVSIYRFIYAIMFVIVYILFNGDILDTLPRRLRAR